MFENEINVHTECVTAHYPRLAIFHKISKLKSQLKLVDRMIELVDSF